MKPGSLFIGKLQHWLLWVAIIILLYVLGKNSIHVRYFVPFCLLLLALIAVAIGFIISTYQPGDNITREAFEDVSEEDT